MHPRTKATLEQLEEVEWFTSVGTEVSGPIIVVSSWQEAIEHCGSVDWKSLLLKAADQYRRRLFDQAPQCLNEWNDIAGELQLHTIPLVDRKIAKVVHQNNLPKVFINTTEWDILHVCMEAEYADIFPPGFYASQAYWYINGHFPCGWEGNFPEGKLIVY